MESDALNEYPKLREEIQAYYENGKRNIGKNYDMHIRVSKASEKRQQELIARIEKSSNPISPDDDESRIDDNL